VRNVCLRSGFRILETFSAIVDIQGQGPAGSELHLEDQGKRVAATLRGYRGKAIPVVTKLQGSIESLAGGERAHQLQGATVRQGQRRSGGS
jgi:hypothetical protein